MPLARRTSHCYRIACQNRFTQTTGRRPGYRSQCLDNLEQAIRDAIGGAVDVALDVVGGSSFMPLVNALRQGGRYSSSGSIAGPLVEFDLRQLVYKDLQLTGATIVPPGTMHRLVSLIEQDLLKPLLAQTFPLQQLGNAQEAFLQKQHVGNIVVEL
jgi:NADPH:quinone reductase-like Zn-dependent oxidoreductase